MSEKFTYEEVFYGMDLKEIQKANIALDLQIKAEKAAIKKKR
jgi:hypothetical protein